MKHCFLWATRQVRGSRLARNRQKFYWDGGPIHMMDLTKLVRTAGTGALAASALAGVMMLSTAAHADGSLKDMAAPSSWWDSVKFSGYIEGGGLGNPGRDRDPNQINWGHLFTDKNDNVQLNQLSLTLERPIDSKKSYDVGFKFQSMFGSDARYTHFLGELDRVTSDKEQFDIVEAWLQFHTPWLGEGGTDIKVGQYVTLEGAEVIDPRGNFFYSHSYIFNFGIPFKHTGILAATHVSSMLDLYYGVDTGVNTTFGERGDNNDAVAFHGGFGLNLMNGDLTILATTHIGPENADEIETVPAVPVSGANSSLRYLSDITAVWKASKALTFTADLNYIRDDLFNADGYGAAGYVSYALNDNLSFGLRGEVWRDSKGFFVGAFPGNLDFVNAEIGRPNTSISLFPQGTTYVAITAGMNIKPTVDKRFEGLVVRPEVRWDHSSDATPFNGGTDDDQFTVGADVVVPFSIISP